MLVSVADARKESFEAQVSVERLEVIAHAKRITCPRIFWYRVLERAVGTRKIPWT